MGFRAIPRHFLLVLGAELNARKMRIAGLRCPCLATLRRHWSNLCKQALRGGASKRLISSSEDEEEALRPHLVAAARGALLHPHLAQAHGAPLHSHGPLMERAAGGQWHPGFIREPPPPPDHISPA
ncbi:unnamed protein product [Boreogadus saida]